MLESTTRLIMDDESSHKPDDIRSLSARSHRDHLNDSGDEKVTRQNNRLVSEKPYGDGPDTATTIKQENRLDLTNAKRQAIILMLSISNEKYSSLKDKNRCFNKWKEVIRAQDTFALQLELARLNKEVETVKHQESLLRTNFRVQKAELESKINTLVSLI